MATRKRKKSAEPVQVERRVGERRQGDRRQGDRRQVCELEPGQQRRALDDRRSLAPEVDLRLGERRLGDRRRT